jgi:hypothetical protein
LAFCIERKSERELDGRRTSRARVLGTRLFAFLALAAFVAGLLGAVIAGAFSGGSAPEAKTSATAKVKPPPPPPPQKPKPKKPVVPNVHLAAVAAYDPEGDGHENDQLVSQATDGDPATFWSTEHYHSFFKSGVGLLLDAGKPVKLPRLIITTDTPGFAAEIRGAVKPTGPFARISAVATISGTKWIPLKMQRPARYFLVWIVSVPTQPADIAGLAHVNEVRVR